MASLFILRAWQSFSTISPSFLLAGHYPLRTPYISSPKHCLLFAVHADTIAMCFAVLTGTEIMLSDPSLSVNPLLGTLSRSLTPHIHLTIFISARWSVWLVVFSYYKKTVQCRCLFKLYFACHDNVHCILSLLNTYILNSASTLCAEKQV